MGNKSVLRLETGTYQKEAIGLYEHMGFRPRGPFGDAVQEVSVG